MRDACGEGVRILLMLVLISDPHPAPLLPLLQEDARTANTAEVAEEDRKAKLPKNFEAKKAQAEWEEAEAKAKKVRPTPPS